MRTFNKETLALVAALADDRLYTPAEVADSGDLKEVKPASVRVSFSKKMKARFYGIGKTYKLGYAPGYYGYQYKAEILGVPLVCPSHLKEELTDEALHDLRMYAQSREQGLNEAVKSLLKIADD